MTDIVEEARAMLAKSAKFSPHPWRLREEEADFEVCDARDEGVAEALTTEDAALIAAAPRLLAALADECERLRSASVQPATFDELNHPTVVKLVAEIPEHPGALGYQITDDDAHHVFVRTGAPRLGMITTLVHEMMHAAEGASGYSIPHRYVAMASFGATVALARCGVLGATDEEIRAFVEYVAGLDRSDEEERDDEGMVDPVEECERLRAENARLREAMPTDEENDALLDLRVATMHLTDSTVLGRWIHRLDAAKEGR